jgi:hypothetical protein
MNPRSSGVRTALFRGFADRDRLHIVYTTLQMMVGSCSRYVA